MRVLRTTLMLALCLTLVAACGAQVKLIETAAKDMNLSAAEVGEGVTMSTDEGLEGLKTSMNLPDDQDIKDASFRMFETSQTGIVLAVIISMNKPADSGALTDLTGGFEKGLAEQMPGVQLKTYNAPKVGDEATVSGVDLPDLGVSMYFLGFRKVNVIGVIGVLGTADFATEAKLAELGQKMDAKIK
jgi:hypothetical protein